MFKRFLLFVVVWVFMVACINVIEVKYDFKADLLTVDGFVTDQNTIQVSIQYSRSTGRSTYYDPVRGCIAEILVNGQPVKLTEFSSGVYVAPNNLKGVPGQTYQLKFTTSKGVKYESTIEKLNTVPAIDKVYHIFNSKGQLDNTGQRVVHSTTDVYIDFQDPATEQNYYLWKTILWERQEICETCTGGGTYQVGRGCVVPRIVPNPPPPDFDYQCEGRCWDIIYNYEILLSSDLYTNGKKTIGRLLQKVPYYRNNGGLIEVQQYSITPIAYRYYDLLRQQSQTTGTLTDTPPAPLVGNVRNIDNPSEPVVGFFAAAGLTKTRYWINRNNDVGAVQVTLLGREPVFEPTTLTRPPLVPCINNPFRTPFKPDGWVGN
jgi:Domain of unknown function (DUF4249)